MPIVRRKFRERVTVQVEIPWGESRRRIKKSSVYDDAIDIVGDDMYTRGYLVATISKNIPHTIREKLEELIGYAEQFDECISVEDAEQEKNEAVSEIEIKYRSILRRKFTYLLVEKRSALRKKRR